MQKVLKHFNFGQSIRNWVKTFYNNITATVLQSGFLSDFFHVERGCRQGDPLSPYLFILCAEILAILIRKNKDIKGICLNGKENKMSLFADDMSLTLDGSEKSVKTTFKILNIFRSVSGLKANLEKTKIIWIGSKKHSQDRICPNLNFDWCDGQFDSLGITFSVDLQNMIDLNYLKVKTDISKLLNQWQKRNITVLGKITVVKTLALSKLSYFLLSLPNPNKQYFEEIQQMFYRFIWGNKPDKIKRSQLIQDYFLGGLKMVNIEDFADSLKTTWLRRTIISSSNWSSLLELIVPSQIPIFEVGPASLQKIIEKTKNSFWKDVLMSWKKILLKFEKQKKQEFVHSESIWLNDNIKVDNQPVFYKLWYDRGIRYICDLLDGNGHLYSYQEFLQKYQLQVNFLQYHGIVKAIQSYLNSMDVTLEKIEFPNITPQCKFLIKNKKGCHDFHSLFKIDTYKIPNCQVKWEQNLQVNEINWKTVHQIPFKTCVDVKLRWFQYRLLNRILATNSFLYKIKISNSPLCDFCQGESETIEHLFLHCNRTESFWLQFKNLIHNKTNNRIYLDNKIKIFGVIPKEKILNMLIILAKNHIYHCKLRKSNPDIMTFIKAIKNAYMVEKYFYCNNLKETEFETRWADWKQIWSEDNQ